MIVSKKTPLLSILGLILFLLVLLINTGDLWVKNEELLIVIGLFGPIFTVFTLLWAIFGLMELNFIIKERKEVYLNYCSKKIDNENYKRAIRDFNQSFKINVVYLTTVIFQLLYVIINWKNQKFLSDDPEEPCSHGQLLIKVGNIIISNEEDGDWVINEAALSLMRTVRFGYPNSEVLPPRYYFAGITEDTLINCCGVYMFFCSSSIKWDVTLLETEVMLSNFVKDEQRIHPEPQIILTDREYARTVYEFALESYNFFSENRRFVKSAWEQFEGQINEFWKEYEKHMKYIEKEFLV